MRDEPAEPIATSFAGVVGSRASFVRSLLNAAGLAIDSRRIHDFPDSNRSSLGFDNTEAFGLLRLGFGAE